MTKTPLNLQLIPGPVVAHVIRENAEEIVEIVSRTYAAHQAGLAVNPDSLFLRYPNNPLNRIIALPAALQAPNLDLSGIKWVASYPDNTKSKLARASAVIVLNDNQTGYPYAILEGAAISATRTAASAVLGALHCSGRFDRQVDNLSITGCGVIARTILDQFALTGWQIGSLEVHDLDGASAQSLCDYAAERYGISASVAGGLETVLAAQIVVFTTSVGTPYVPPEFRFNAGQCVLNISLRDLAPEQILAAQNIFDDVDHCLKANTSAHLAEQVAGHRNFAVGNIAQLVAGDISLRPDQPVIFSPFGMGILDLAVADLVYRVAVAEGLATEVPDFFGDVSRW